MDFRRVLFALFLCGAIAQPDPDEGLIPDPGGPGVSHWDPEGQATPFVPEDSDLQPRRQFRTAEMADAVLGTELSAHTAGIQALLPKGEAAVSAACGDQSCQGDAAGLGPHPAEEDTGGPAEDDSAEGETAGPGTSPAAGSVDETNTTETTKTYKVSCEKRSIAGQETLMVQVLNASQDLMDFLNANGTECTLVLFYTTWCQFSANLAPHFNALPRVFPSMHFLALDAAQHSSLSTRFGTVAVPNILLFQGSKPMARFNHTDRTLETLTAFITNQTGFEAVPGQCVLDSDRSGPLLSVQVKSVDWLFVFSVLFIVGFSLYAVLRTDSVRLLIPGQEHEHQD